MGKKKISDEQIVSEYEKYGSVWKVAESVGMCGQSVHERLIRLGVIKHLNIFSEKDLDVLRSEYIFYRNAGRLDILAEKLGRTKYFICRKAKSIGLTDQKANKPYAEKPGSNPYARYHQRVRSERGKPLRCDVCGENSPEKWYEWANLTGDYENILDYRRMCRKCHRKHDKNRKMLAHKHFPLEEPRTEIILKEYGE